MRQLLCYKIQHKFVIKSVKFFITKYVDFIIKCDNYYKMRQIYYTLRQLLQNATVLARPKAFFVFFYLILLLFVLFFFVWIFCFCEEILYETYSCVTIYYSKNFVFIFNNSVCIFRFIIIKKIKRK